MSQFVEKLEKEREDHEKSIKRLTLAELREKVSDSKSRLTAVIEPEMLRAKTENKRRTIG